MSLALARSLHQPWRQPGILNGSLGIRSQLNLPNSSSEAPGVFDRSVNRSLDPEM